MQVSQRYSRHSEAAFGSDFFRLDLATEQGRPPVRLEATIKDGLAYSRLMQGLYAVVTSDYGSAVKDHSAYQAWVQQRYMDELSNAHSAVLAKLPGWKARRDELQTELRTVRSRFQKLSTSVYGGSFAGAKRKYFNYLYTYDRDAWIVLDPVISVHPDCLVFEAFSRDESTYGRVTVPLSDLDLHAPVQYGTTNIDFSPDLAREIERVRSYRPTTLQVTPQAVGMATTTGSVIEKKIDLPDGWLRGFLQVQSASGMSGTDLQLSPATLADILTELNRQREDKGPRSLRFELQPGEKPLIVLEPWGTEVREAVYPYKGETPQVIRMWGRRRLLTLENLLPYATGLQVRLLGTGLPSYWSVFYRNERLDLGLSGWTQNDWSRSAQFDLLAGIREVKADDLKVARNYLVNKLVATPQAVAADSNLSRETAQAALQQLCRDGQAMYDHLAGVYRYRPLFSPEVLAQTKLEPDPRLAAARRFLSANAVHWTAAPRKDPPKNAAAAPKNARREFLFQQGTSNKFWAITLQGDSHTVEFGRIGTKGQSQAKEFDSNREAKDSAEKLIREKVSKGYIEQTPPPAAAPPSQPGESAPVYNGRTRYEANVKGQHDFKVTVDLDPDGRVVYAECTCSEFRHDKLRKGPCPHILATVVKVLEQPAE